MTRVSPRVFSYDARFLCTPPVCLLACDIREVISCGLFARLQLICIFGDA